MATLFEKIAAKKAAEALAAKEMATTPEQKLAGFMKEAEVQEKEAEAMAASVPEGKPLSFAEKMALKRSQSESTSISATATADTVKNSEKNSLPTVDANAEKIPEAVVIGIVANVAEEEDHTAEVESASPEDQQAYYDIKAKINLLSDMSEANLPGAMKELKTALLKNPQACYLILPQDIGQMVIALRAMKNEAIVDATKTPKEKKAKASKALTADEIAQAFDEL